MRRLIIERLGYSFVVVSALSLYSVRLLGVSLLPESAPEVSGPLALVLELAKPMCTSLLLIAAFTFVKDVSPLTSAATVEGVFGALYFGVGRGLGGLAGAIAWELIGARNAFRVSMQSRQSTFSPRANATLYLHAFISSCSRRFLSAEP